MRSKQAWLLRGKALGLRPTALERRKTVEQVWRSLRPTAAHALSATDKPRSHVRRTISRYRRARQSLRTPASIRSRLGLDWASFFIADVQTGFGTFVAFYLASLGWSQASVGFALGLSGIAGVLAQIPGGALADAVPWKRGLVALGVIMLCGSALILATMPAYWWVFAAETLHGLSSGLISPAIAAISLGLVGRPQMSLRTGRNFRFAAAGTALTALVLGAIGSFVSARAIFLAAAALCAPALIAIGSIRAEEIDYARARNAGTGERASKLHRVIDLAKNRNLLMFACCLVLFQFANASMLPLVSEGLAVSGAPLGSLLLSGLIIAPQIVVAILAPWVGYHSEVWGRKPLLLLGLGLVAVRAALFALVTSYPAMLVIQLLDGISGATISVLIVLVITDLTAGTGRFNLVQGVIGSAMGIAASLSTSITGLVFQDFGRLAGFLFIAAVATAATAGAALFLPETKPERYQD
jgi:MFS family permease